MEFGHDKVLLDSVLAVYKPHCRYLRETSVTVKGDPQDKGGLIRLRGDFRIPESCYIKDTGHFNAVEFNICFNQMIYFIMAKSLKERVLRAFDSWTMEDFWARQLPDMFIVDFSSSFRDAMRGRRFWGELDIVRAVNREGGNGQLIIIDTLCRYGETETAACHGKVRLALKNTAPEAA
ncbi:FcoT family thioesterase [Streptomyces sp. MP131-18]|uniref:FcoT family thioesterase n=1 Tax=Streptomyces sp. MP131-18 TaxID=1857892 RepID=UPI00097BB91A|nr:FcoT family thioesterase [Streptomyces sp. MP131-18]ONK10104.1 FcoT-like thioesterase domain protein [Streptomyces sp. MP131-18]